MTTEALKALVSAGLSRRSFLKRSGFLLVGFGGMTTTGVDGLSLISGVPGVQGSEIDASLLDSWLAVTADGYVKAYTGKCELGQGIRTAQVQLIAEELGVDVGRIEVVQCDTAVTPDQGTTSGSQSHPENFNHENLAQAAATAREALLRMASEQLGVSIDQLTITNGTIGVLTEPSKRIEYGALVGGRKFEIPLNRSARRKQPNEWTVMGSSLPRLDFPAMMTGRFEFVHNVRVPGMLHGCVVRPPAVGARLKDVDTTSVQDSPGFVDAVVRNDFVGVVAEKPWQAMQIARRLKVSWSPGVPLPSHRGIYDHLRQQTPVSDSVVVDSGDCADKRDTAAMVVQATYLHPYQMHGSLGASCALADVRGDRATIWSATQSVYALRSTTSMLLGFPEGSVRVVYVRGSGCYGINGADSVSYDAALMSQAVGRPVRVQLSRRDEMAWENYGYAYVIDQRVGVGSDGTIVTWDCETWFPRLGGRPGYRTPGNVVTGRLAGFQPAPLMPGTRSRRADVEFNNRSNAAPSYVAGYVNGRCGGTGTIRSERVLSHSVESALFTGPLRSPSRLQNTFAHECLIDEVATKVVTDPVTYRIRHLADERLIEVVQAAAKRADWQSRPSPIPGISRTGITSGRGIACVLYEGFNGYAAIVAEVDVDQDSALIMVKRLVIAHDCGPISNPDGLKNQIEGGALQGLSRALGEEVTWNDTRITSVNWRSYKSLSVGFDAPLIECVLINRPEGRALGAGETSITVVAAAVGNAIFDATGARLRQVPFTPERLREALDARPGTS